MTRRLRLALALVACAALVAAACGGEVEVTVSTDDGAVAPATQAPEAEPDTTEPNATQPDTTTEATAAEPGEEPDTTTETAAAEPDEEPEAPPPNIFDDPRDGIFDEFQATFDRSDHPFAQLDAFCHAHDPAPDRVATDPGIEADSISLVHLRSRLEDFAAIGFAVPVGNVAEMFDTFVAVVNEQCGGVRGRTIELQTIELEVLGATIDEDRNAACIQAIEDYKGVVLLNSSGFQGSANLCIVEEHQTAFVSTQGQSEEFMRRGEDRLISVSPTLEESVRWLAADLADRGQLDGKTIGVAAPDTPGQYEAVESGLVDTLASKGIDVAVFDVIGCGGATACTQGVVESVQRMRAAGVDVFFNVLNVISFPGYLLEMANQGFEPGDVQFYASDFNAQAGELVSSKVVAYGGETAGSLYNGALIIDDADTGVYRLEGYEPRPFNEMGKDTHRGNNAPGAHHKNADRLSGSGSSAYGMVATVCNLLRTALRAIYEAGDNPTRADIYATL
ncbi:MAG: ABC transporter substrate-binding protein, partial [Acidimicrobiaceae bacterium]|nr:ABC transporter substrate-binding protein [Acidimicrobiaceae bacterium]